jgi:hypothetical protein
MIAAVSPANKDIVNRKPRGRIERMPTWGPSRQRGGTGPSNPRIIDRKAALKGYHGPIRQLTITDLGHEKPTLLLTNQLRRSPAKLIGR